MKKTLLHKVTTIEEEARAMVATARQEGERALETVRSNEDQSIGEIQRGAKNRGKQIIDERMRGAQAEIGKITQESEQSVRMVHEASEHNRQEALKKAHQLLLDAYVS